MRTALLILLAAGALAGCAGPSAQEDKETFKSFGWEWRGKDHPASYPVTPTSASTSDPQGLSAEEREFQDWRAWQEWRRKNPK